MMKIVSVIIAVIALTSIASANTVSIGNGLLFNEPYIVPLGDTESMQIDVTAAGVHIQGFNADYFGDDSSTFIGTVSFTNGTAINSQMGAATAMGAVLALMGADYANVEVAMAADGTYNGATPDASIKVGAYKSEDSFVLVAASNSNVNGDHGATQVAFQVRQGSFVSASNEQSSRLNSF